MPRNDVACCRTERLDVEGADEPHGDRDVVDRGGRRVELVEEPVALLRERQRNPIGSFGGDEGPARTAGDPPFEARCKLFHGGGLEQQAQRNGGVQRGTDAGDHLGGDERVAAQREEVVVESDAVDTEDLGVDRRDDLLGGRGGSAELLDLEDRFGQCFAVELAGRTERHGVEEHVGGGHHVGRQLRGQCRTSRHLVEGRTGLRDDVGDELVLTDEHDGLVDLVEGEQRGLDLAEFDAQTAELDLEVGAADVVEFAGASVQRTRSPVRYSRSPSPNGDATKRSAVRSGRCMYRGRAGRPRDRALPRPPRARARDARRGRRRGCSTRGRRSARRLSASVASW